MPLNSTQLAALVERARLKTPPVVSSPSPAQRPARPRQLAPGPQVPSATPPNSAAGNNPRARSAEPQSPGPTAAHVVEAEDFPVGWQLDKNSWRFHRRFYAVFRRPMARGEYSHLFRQIRSGRAEHLGEDCWRVTLPSGSRTLSVRASTWFLITILPKDWQPQARADAEIGRGAASRASSLSRPARGRFAGQA